MGRPVEHTSSETRLAIPTTFNQLMIGRPACGDVRTVLWGIGRHYMVATSCARDRVWDRRKCRILGHS